MTTPSRTRSSSAAPGARLGLRPAPAEGAEDVALFAAEQAREAYARAHRAGEAIGAGFGAGLKTAGEGLTALNLAMLDAVRANTDAGVDFLKAFMQVRSLSEAVELQGVVVRDRMEALTGQTREILGHGARLATASVQPVQDALGRALGGKD